MLKASPERGLEVELAELVDRERSDPAAAEFPELPERDVPKKPWQPRLVIRSAHPRRAVRLDLHCIFGLSSVLVLRGLTAVP